MTDITTLRADLITADARGRARVRDHRGSKRMSEQTPETDALHEELMRHHLSTGGRNLGQYRTAWKCECGYEFVTDGHRDISLRYAWNEHLAHVAVRVLRPGQPTAQPPNPTTAGEQAASGAGEA